MKFIFDQLFAEAHQEMENETPERELKINPNSVTADKFKSFTCSFMFSTLEHFNLLSVINTKLDQVILSHAATESRVLAVEEDIVSFKADMNAAMDFKDGELSDLREEVEAGKQRMLKLEDAITQLTNKHDLDLASVKKQCNKLGVDTLTLERYTRSYNLRLFNMVEPVGEKTSDVITKVNALISEVTGTDIKVEYGHRTGPKRNDGKQRAVIVRIASRQERAVVMGKRAQFFIKGNPIYDDLPFNDLEEKKKHADAMQEKWSAKHKTQFVRGKWYLDGVVYNGE